MLRCLEKLAEIVGFKSFGSLGNNGRLSVKRGERRYMILISVFRFFHWAGLALYIFTYHTDLVFFEFCFS